MQVLEYHIQPVAYQIPSAPSTIDTAAFKSPANQSSVNAIINSTIEVINETLQQVVNKVEAEKAMQMTQHRHSFEEDWNFLYFLRLLFYVVVIIKIIELVFSKRKKMDIKERVYRKYVFSHAEMIREFNEQDRQVMDTTLKNTIKNASIDKTLPKLLKKTSSKKVIFHETKNEYFEPKKDQQNTDGHSPLQVFLSRPVKILQIQRQLVQQEPSDQDFQITETITELKQTNESIIFTKNHATQSSITQSTAQSQFSSISGSTITDNQQQKTEHKQKDL